MSKRKLGSRTLSSWKYKAYVREELFRKQKGICFECLNKFPKPFLTVDHYIPKCLFPKNHIIDYNERQALRRKRDSLENLVLMCKNCNEAKSGCVPEISIKSAWQKFEQLTNKEG